MSFGERRKRKTTRTPHAVCYLRPVYHQVGKFLACLVGRSVYVGGILFSGKLSLFSNSPSTPAAVWQRFENLSLMAVCLSVVIIQLFFNQSAIDRRFLTLERQGNLCDANAQSYKSGATVLVDQLVVCGAESYLIKPRLPQETYGAQAEIGAIIYRINTVPVTVQRK